MAERALAAFDTSVIVAALLGWHEHHAPALRELQGAFERGDVLVPGPALVETYAVMTRLPAPHRISPTDARVLLQETFENAATVVTLTANELWRLVRALPDSDVAGGRSYDAHILACARKGRATQLWTFNERDFLALEPEDVAIRCPEA